MGASIAQQPGTTGQEATRAAAQRAFQEGLQLFQQGTAESLRQAIAKLEEALRLYRTVGDKQWEATILIDTPLSKDEGILYSTSGFALAGLPQLA